MTTPNRIETESEALELYGACPEEERDQWLEDHHDELYEIYMHQMPYGTAKARDGCPYEWIMERMEADVDK